MNEGCATYCHHRIMTALHERGQITDGAFLEFLQSHTNVIRQPEFDDRHFGGINPYALGFAMMSDIDRICIDPTEGGSGVVPGDRRQRRFLDDAQGSLGKLSRRELRRPVPQPTPHPRMADVPL